MSEQQTTGDVTRLLQEWKAGDTAALNALFEIVNASLRGMAVRRLQREPFGCSLQITLLVDEVFAHLIRLKRAQPSDRRAFFACAAHVMRSTLVNAARKRLAKKRGGDMPRVE